MDTALPQKLKILQPFKKFTAFYGPRRFIPDFIKRHHFFVSRAISLQSTPTLMQFIKIRFNIVFASSPKSLKWSLSLNASHQRAICSSLPFNTSKILPSFSFSLIWSVNIFDEGYYVKITNLFRTINRPSVRPRFFLNSFLYYNFCWSLVNNVKLAILSKDI